MKLSRKFDIYSLIITAIFIIALIVSFNTVNFLTKETSELNNIIQKFDYLINLRNSLANLEHSLEDYLYDLPGKRQSDDVESDLLELEQIIKLSDSVNIQNMEKELRRIGIEEFREFSEMVRVLLRDEGEIDEQNIKTYEEWKKNFLDQVSAEIDLLFEEDLKKANKHSEYAEVMSERTLMLLLLAALIMFFILILSRVIASRIVMKPINVIWDASKAIAAGDTDRRIEVRSNDELGSLSGSINIMAEAIGEKIKSYQYSIEKEHTVAREKTMLSDLMGFIASGVDIKTQLRTFLDSTRDLVRAEHSSIFILERRDADAEPELKIFYTTLEEGTSMDCARLMLNGVFGEAIKTGTPLRTNTMDYKVPDSHFPVKNLLALPLSSTDMRNQGLLVLVNKEGGFTQDDEKSLSNFSSLAFQAITMQQEIIRYASTDGLTGLNNHRVFIDKLREEMERARKYSRDISLLMIDINHFGSFRDIYGRQSGDHVLTQVAKLVIDNIRTIDFAARYSGEEFAVILPETSRLHAAQTAERLNNSINNNNFVLESGEYVKITASIGYASYPEDADTGEELIKNADEGISTISESGKNKISRYYDLSGKSEDKVPDEIKDILHAASITNAKELAKAIDSKSSYMRGHSFEVAALAVMAAKELKLSEDEIESLRIASLLHDISNLAIPGNLINKSGPLTDEEKNIIEDQSGIPEKLLRYYPESENILPAILYHHERFDGKGTHGLKEGEIPVTARILGLVEAYQAMISPRPYREKMTMKETIDVLKNEAGKQFDPKVVNIFIDLLNKTRTVK